MRVLVVCGLSETMASLWPTMRLRSVDLPALCRPRNETKPDLPLILDGCRLAAAEPDLGDTPTLDLEHLDVETIDVEALADVRHASQVREQVPADSFESLAFDCHAESIHDLVDAHLSTEDERAVGLLDDRFALDVVLVANLADDLLEQILDGDEPGGAAVLVHDDGHLRLAPLHVFEQLRHPFAFG